MSSPAQVSGPGALSRRTDTGGQPIRALPDPQYGEATAYEQQQKGAPLAEQRPTPNPRMPEPSAGPSPLAQPSEPPVGLFAASQRPDEPITAGAPSGAGPNTLAGGPLAPRAYATSDQLREYAGSDPSGSVAWLANLLSSQGL
ncbi:hypothetical protein [Umezawaea sp. NPDC059074]|uniref:hypothetical protein n=1 Tax=Umezawaea sp. NPDC059074 TaxID=3346716 RepID=UPI0036888F59